MGWWPGETLEPSTEIEAQSTVVERRCFRFLHQMLPQISLIPIGEATPECVRCPVPRRFPLKHGVSVLYVQ